MKNKTLTLKAHLIGMEERTVMNVATRIYTFEVNVGGVGTGHIDIVVNDSNLTVYPTRSSFVIATTAKLVDAFERALANKTVDNGFKVTVNL